MAKVAIWGSLRSATGGKAEVEVDASNVRELLQRLSEDYPALRDQLRRGVSVSVDGQLYSNAWLVEIKPNSDVVLLPRIVGG